jgi:hypothetical protein
MSNKVDQASFSTQLPLAREEGSYPTPQVQKVHAYMEALKGTTGLYGFMDFLKFKIGMFFKRKFNFLTLAEIRQQRFYDRFQTLKEALQAKSGRDEKIKNSYDALFEEASDLILENVSKQAILNILKEELSEQTTKDLLQGILLYEGRQLATTSKDKADLTDFIYRFDAAVKKALTSHYGNEEEIKDAFIEVAVQVAAQDENANLLDDLLAVVEQRIEFANRANVIVPQQEFYRCLGDFQEPLSELILAGKPITAEALEQIQVDGVFLMKGISNPQELIEILEQLRKKYSFLVQERRVANLSRELEGLEFSVLEKEAQLEAKKSYSRQDLAECLELEQADLQEQLKGSQLKMDRLKKEIEAAKKECNQAIQLDQRVAALPRLRAEIEKKRIENRKLLEGQDQMFVEELKELKAAYDAVVEQNTYVENFSLHMQTSETISWGVRLHLWWLKVEFQAKFDNFKVKYPHVNVDEICAKYISLPQEIEALEKECAIDVPANAKSIIASIPRLKASIMNAERQLKGQTIEHERLSVLNTIRCTEDPQVQMSPQVMLRLKFQGIAENHPVAKALAEAQILEAEYKEAQQKFERTSGEYREAYGQYSQMLETQPEVPADRRLFALDDFLAEIMKNIELQLQEKLQNQEKETEKKALDVVHRISAAKAQADLKAWENTFRNLDPSLQRSYLSSGRVLVRFNPDQLRMLRCKELEVSLRTF